MQSASRFPFCPNSPIGSLRDLTELHWSRHTDSLKSLQSIENGLFDKRMCWTQNPPTFGSWGFDSPSRHQAFQEPLRCLAEARLHSARKHVLFSDSPTSNFHNHPFCHASPSQIVEAHNSCNHRPKGSRYGGGMRVGPPFAPVHHIYEPRYETPLAPGWQTQRIPEPCAPWSIKVAREVKEMSKIRNTTIEMSPSLTR